jgi:hypothetical protein
VRLFLRKLVPKFVSEFSYRCLFWIPETLGLHQIFKWLAGFGKSRQKRRDNGYVIRETRGDLMTTLDHVYAPFSIWS